MFFCSHLGKGKNGGGEIEIKKKVSSTAFGNLFSFLLEIFIFMVSMIFRSVNTFPLLFQSDYLTLPRQRFGIYWMKVAKMFVISSFGSMRKYEKCEKAALKRFASIWLMGKVCSLR